MKKVIYTVVGLLALWGTVQAQSYQFSKQSATYQDLVNPTVLVIDTFTGYHQMPLDYPINAFGRDIGDSVLIGLSGFVLAWTDDYSFAFDPFVVNMRFTEQSSQISYETSGSIGSRTFKVEWRNMGVKDRPGDKVNVQVWFLEVDNSIEFHFGNSIHSESATSGIFLLDETFTTIRDAYWLGGNPEQPQLNVASAPKIESAPSEGMVYRFGFTPNAIEQPSSAQLLGLYPNPSTGSFYLEQENINKLRAFDMMGREVEVLKEGTAYSLAASEPGVYLVFGYDEDGNLFRGKVVLDHRP